MAQILVIDDDDDLRNMYRLVLEREGHEVIDAPNGEVGDALYRKNHPDLVITDLIMPEKEGLQTIKELLRDFPDAKIIAISGGAIRLAPQDFLRIAKLMGARRVLSKPVLKAELLQVVREVLESA